MIAIPTEELLLDLRAMHREWKRNGETFGSSRVPAAPATSSAPIVQVVEVTSTTADSYGYPARIQSFDGSTWSDVYSEVRAVRAGGGVLALGFYVGRLIRIDSGYHIYAVGVGTSHELRGLTFTSDTDSTADTDPGNGLFKWNNATQSIATVLYVDNQTADGKSVSTLFAKLGPTGYLYLQQADDSEKWQLWKWIKTPENGTGYYKFTVTSQSYGGAIADNKLVYLDFACGAELTGPKFVSDTSSTSDTDPGNGKFKWNNATQSSATQIYVDNQTVDSIAINTAWSSLGSDGYIYIQQCDNHNNWQLWKWSGVPVDRTGYYRFEVTSQSYGGAIDNDRVCFFDIDSEGGLRARKNSTGSTYGPRSRFNFIEGNGVTLTLADDSVNNEIDLTIATGLSGARVYNSGGFLGLTTTTALTFDSESFDTDGYHSTVSNTSRLTVPADGRYLIGCEIGIDDSTSANYDVGIILNGTTTITHWQQQPLTGIDHCTLCTPWSATANDYFEVVITNPTSANIAYIDKCEPVFWIVRLS